MKNDPLIENMKNAEFMTAFQVLSQAVTTQANWKVVAPMNPNVGTPTSRVRDSTRINSLEFYGSNLEEDPYEFIDEVHKVLGIMGVTSVDMEELATYQLKGVAWV